MRPSPFRYRTIHIIIAVTALLGCGADGSAAPDAAPPVVSARLVAGNGQTAEAGAALALPIRIVAMDGSGRPIAGASVQAVQSGDGVVSPRKSTTGPDGTAEFTWILGSARGTQTITAQVGNAPSTVNVIVAATATRPMVKGMSVTLASAALAGSTVVATALATDARFNPVIDAPIVWQTSNSAIATVSGAGTTAVVTAHSAGSATLTASTDGVTATHVIVVREPFVELSVGANHACARTASGSVYCWGYNDAGEVGDGTTLPQKTPTLVSTQQKFVQVSAGAGYTCARTAAGEIHCWGDNSAGQLGDGTTTRRLAPTRVIGSEVFADVSAGRDNAYGYDCEWTGCGHTCALNTVGAAVCWGGNETGQLGRGTESIRESPGRVAGDARFVGISTGGGHTCAWTAGGIASCWGYNFSGQLGGAATEYRSTVPAAMKITGFVEMSASLYHSCGRILSGSVYCWGFNGSGQIGNGTSTHKFMPSIYSAPTIVEGGLVFSAITVGYHHSCGLTTSGAAYCWGYNSLASLGDGTRGEQWVPTAVAGNLSFVKIGAGYYHTCALTGQGAVYCWGAALTSGPAILMPTRVQ